MVTPVTQEKGPERTTAIKATEAVKRVRGMVKEMYRQGHVAEAEGKPRAYAWLGGAQNEIFRAMDITPIWIENYAGLCAAKRAAEPFLAKSASEGFRGDLCTYTTNCIGFCALQALGQVPPDAPDGGLPRPTMMIGGGTMMVCDPRHKLFPTLRRYYNNVPVYTYNLLWPIYDANIKEIQGYYIKYMVAELKGLVEFLEKQTGRKMDWDRLAEIVATSEKTLRLMRELHQLRKSIPCVMPTQDAWNCMVPSGFLLGSQESLEFCRDLIAEVKYRNEHKMGVIPDEKYRIMWGGGIAPWHTLSLLNYFERFGAVMCAEGRRSYGGEYEEIPASVTYPLERLVRRFFQQSSFIHEKAQKHTGDPRVETLLESIEDYKIDGIVFHQVFTCRTVHVGQIHTMRLLRQYVDLPQLLIEGDIVDPKLFPEAETHAKIDAFIELVDASKKRKGQS